MSVRSTVKKLILQKISVGKSARRPAIRLLISVIFLCPVIVWCDLAEAQSQRDANSPGMRKNDDKGRNRNVPADKRDTTASLITALPPLKNLPAHIPQPWEFDVEKVIARLKANTETHDVWTAQDSEGVGILRRDNKRFSAGASERSEPVYPSFVLGPRRQTDSLVRQAIKLLPKQIALKTSFVLPDRILQCPEAYLAQLRKKPYVVVFGSFVGIGSSAAYPGWAKSRHEKELQALRDTLQLLKALDRKILLVCYAMGDSISEQALPVRTGLQERKNALLAEMGLAHLADSVTWGADELPFVVFARLLPTLKVAVRISNPEARLHYDGKRTAAEVVREKLGTLGLEMVADGKPAHLRVLVMTRRPGGNEDSFHSNDAAQKEFDTKFIESNWADDNALVKRTALVDIRIFNGAWDAQSLPRTCSGLAFGAWGTASNALGSTMGIAKILAYANNPAAQKQLWLEAFAHDVFANGYAESQRGRFRQRLKSEARIDFEHHKGYSTADTTATVFRLLNDHVNERMQSFFAGTECTKGLKFKLTPQLWRTFESEIHIWPQTESSVFEPGVFRKESAPLNSVFSPLVAP